MPEEATRDQMIYAAEKLVVKGLFREAIAEYKQLLASSAFDVNTVNRIGDLYVRVGDISSAVRAFESIAKYYASEGQFLKAIAVYKKVNKLDPSVLGVYEALADLYARQGLHLEFVSQLQVLADYYAKHGEPGEAARLRARILVAQRTSAPEDPQLAAQPADPTAGLPVVGVPVVNTSADMLVFLCHASEDKPAVRELYATLSKDNYQPWLDEEDLLPGQDWEAEIQRAVRRSHVVLVCLSSRSITKAGFLQKEIRFALNVLAEQPEGIIFVVPARLEDCRVPDSLKHLHYVDLFGDRGYSKLRRALDARARQLFGPR